MTRTITTAAELDALPVGSVVITADGRLLHKSTRGNGSPAWFEGTQRCAMTSVSILNIAGPLMVLNVVPEAVTRGLAQSAAGETADLGDFTQSVVPDAARTPLVERIEGTWLVEVTDEHTCGGGPGSGTGMHEPGCGLVPVVDLATLPGWDEHLTAAPSATREAAEDEVTEVVTEALTDAYRAERGMSRHTGLTARDESVIRDQAAHVVNLADARFTITPKEDR